MLDTDQLIELEILAREEIARLESESEEAEKNTEAIAPDPGLGRLTRLDAMQMQEMAKEAQRQRGLRVHRLNEALERMDDGTYGICSACAGWIEYERLASAPEVLKCRSCSG